jgi:hypothetical protein
MFYQIRLALSLCLVAGALQAQSAPPMVRIPAGPFLMGSAEGAIWEKPVHEVHVSAFEISKRPVTLSEYRAFRPSHPNPTGLPENVDAGSSPVTGISWEDANAYCEWLTEGTGRRYRMPTEAEWEKAIRGGLEGKRYPWGDDPPVPADKISDTAYRVAERANPLGVFAGTYNLWEWVADGYSADYYRDSAARDPKGPADSRYRVLRGGGYRSDPNSMRCANRGSARPKTTSDVITFRIASGETAPTPKVSEAPPKPAPEPKPTPAPARVRPPAATPPTPAATVASGGAVRVTGISVEAGSSLVTVTIRTSGPPKHKTMVLSGPDRLVIDIVGGTMAAPRAQQRVDVAALGISRVRSAQFKNTPPVSRTVVDMDAMLNYDIAVENDGLVVWLKKEQ